MEQIRLSDIKIRTFGWVQNPSDFNKLKKVVQVFDHTSEIHSKLKDNRIPLLIEERDGRDKFIEELNKKPLKLKYSDLIGTSFTPRSSARCNGIIQATIKGQGSKKFIDDWSSDGFIRWAHALGFIDYDYSTDSFFITRLGFDFSRSIDDSQNEKQIIIEAILSYPPAVRVLDLLSSGDHLTKYEIGKKLGFTGEAGFTSLPQNILLDSLASCDDSKEKSKMRNDWDGSSDKYARMISGWLCKLDLVRRVRKQFDIHINGSVKTEFIGHAYKITTDGLRQLRRAHGTNIAQRITKRVYWEMFATNAVDKSYIRTRRAYILKSIANTNSIIAPDKIQQMLKAQGLEENIETIKHDIKGLINIGLNIVSGTRGYKLKDNISDFMIPVISVDEANKSDIEEVKAELRTHLKFLSHDYLDLVDLSQKSSQNRLFEMKVMDLFINEYEFCGSHLGGSRKPDGAMYTTGLENNYGVIVDTKAYKSGYSLPINQADEMERYIRENIDRNENVNPNKWWDIFPNELEEYKFLFVSSYFKGNFENHLERLSTLTGTYGGVINVEHLLLGAEYIKRGVLTLDILKNEFKNTEILF